MQLQHKRTRLLLILSAIFITSAITAELISAKLIQVPLDLGFVNLGTYVAIIGILPWPVVFLTTDIVNEFYGRKVVRWLSVLTSCMIAYSFVIVYLGMQPKAFTGSPEAPIPGVADDTTFNLVFGQSLWIIIGSITAFFISQLIDSFMFWIIRERTGGRFIWLRSTGSTVISQLIDSFVVLYIGFVVPGKFTHAQWWESGWLNYVLKLVIALGLTPLIYLFHYLVKKYLGKDDAEQQIRHTAEESLHHKTDD